MTRTPDTYTLLDVINAVGEFAETKDELVATVAYLVNTGKVKLCGDFAGSTVEIDPGDTQLGAA